jgi:hypothetical protein
VIREEEISLVTGFNPTLRMNGLYSAMRRVIIGLDFYEFKLNLLFVLSASSDLQS